VFRQLKRIFGRNTPALPPIAQRAREEGLTYLNPARMASLTAELSRLEELDIAGDLAEFGIALGGSSIVIASMRGNRRFAGYDVFGRIPAPGSSDGEDAHSRYKIIESGHSSGIGGAHYYGYQNDLYSTVVSSFERYGLHIDQSEISLHKGLFEETYHPRATDRLAFAHIDCDWYDPVYYCLTKASPILSDGGTVIVDDYNDYEGCRKAVDRVLEEDKTLYMHRSQPHAVMRKRQ
jgi:asparagine synthase (glutamine-hydrolysing)